MNKNCPKCETPKPVSSFYLRNGKADGWCKSCMSLHYSNREKTPEMRKKASEASQRWRAKNLEKAKRYSRASTLRQYGLTIEQYEEMLESQSGKCAICDRTPPVRKDGKTPFLVVDHNHDTGAVRKLLCIRCNSHLGWYEKYQAQITNYSI